MIFGSRLWPALVLLAALAGCAPEPPRYDNLVLVMIDTLRSDHLPSYGYERDTAPTLTRLADEGLQVQGHAASSWTKPSVATLLSGLQPQRHQAIGRADRLPDEVFYLPARLAGEGFSTAAFVGNRNVGRKFGFARGFARFEMTRATGKIDGPRVTAEALELAGELEPPYFLYVHYVDPHDPYRPPRPFGDTAPGSPYVQPRHVRDGRAPRNAESVRRMIDQYDGEILEVDAEVGKLLAGLAELGLDERTLVVVTSDHGEEFLEHGELTHGTGLHREVLEVPMILWSADGRLGASPDSTATRRRSFHQVDFAATALAALGLEPAAGDGRGRWSELVAGGELGETEDRFYHLDLDGRGALAVERWPRKLIHSAAAPHDRLFDLERDPLELSPILSDPEIPRLRRRLVVEHNRLGALAARRQQQELDDETRRGLAALGYLQLDTPQAELAQRSLPSRLPRDTGLAP